jgi:hypothetical protein
MKILLLALILCTTAYAQTKISCRVVDLFDPTFFKKDLDSKINNKVLIEQDRFGGLHIFIGKDSFSTDRGDSIKPQENFGFNKDFKFKKSGNGTEFRIIANSQNKKGQLLGKDFTGENQLVANLSCFN